MITITSPEAKAYDVTDPVAIAFTATDAVSGVKDVLATLNGQPVENGDVIDVSMLLKGDNTLLVEAMDKAGNSSSASVTFQFDITIDGLIETVETSGFQEEYRTCSCLHAQVDPARPGSRAHHAGKTKDDALHRTGESFQPEVHRSRYSQIIDRVCNLVAYASAQCAWEMIP